LGAHADDIEIGCGGTLLRWLRESPEMRVVWVVLSADEVRGREAEASARQFLREARESQVVIKSFRDTFFPFVGEAIKEYFHELSQSVAPDVVFTHRLDDRHQDHRLTSELTWCAFRDHLVLEYDVPKYEGDLGRPNFFVTLDESTCRQKADTLFETFVSQHNKSWFSKDTFWALMRLRGVECNSPSGFAEGFLARKLVVSKVGNR
jgi:LmbE family N-acetylglucosaminyl deacetylase